MSAKQSDAELEAAALNRVIESFRHYRQYSVRLFKLDHDSTSNLQHLPNCAAALGLLSPIIAHRILENSYQQICAGGRTT
jgi:hypothetical protein